MESTYDVVVVGSGFGGGVTACRLAEQGLRVCVLERGRRFGPGDFPDRPEQAPLAFWHPVLNPGGMLDLRLMKDLAVITAAGVGGGSLVYANVQLRAPADVFEEAAWPGAITRAELDPYYDRTEEALRAAGDARGARAAEDPRLRPRWPSTPAAPPRDFPSPCTSARAAATRSATSSSTAARTSGAATWGARCWPRTPSTSPTSRVPRRTGPRSSRCTRWFVSIHPAEPARAGGSAFATCSTGSVARSRHRCSSWPPGRSEAVVCY